MRCLPVLAALLWYSTAFSDDAAAQAHDVPEPLTQQVSAGAATGVVGIVTDETGIGIEGASVLAMGATVAVVRTGHSGQFNLSLAPGPYILRAARDGYISTFREAVQVRTDAPLARHIMMLRADATMSVALASFEQLPSDAVVPQTQTQTQTETQTEQALPAPASASETVWRLRHLPRTVLRDGITPAWQGQSEDYTDFGAATTARTTMAMGPLAQADLNGHVDLLTTGSLPSVGDLPTAEWPRGVAYVVLGAPVGSHGSWSVRTSMAGGRAPAWTFIGEYASNASRAHAFRAGVSYSAQTIAEPADRHSLASVDTVRRVGGVHVSDQWTVHRHLQVDSSLRVTRYDYLTDPTLASGRVAARHTILPRMAIVGAVSSHMVAPGGEQFAAPMSSGVWLPPERTFSSLEPLGELKPQHVQFVEIGTDTTLKYNDDGDADLTLRVRRFSERSSNQIVAVFGLDEASHVGHYYVSTPGGVALEGWLIGISGRLAPHVQATVDYAATIADWNRASGQRGLWRAARSAARHGAEQLHDVTAAIDATVPSTSTSITVAIRVNSGFSRSQSAAPGAGGRFAFEVRQQLPVQPLGHGELNLLFSARTLLRQVDDLGGFYDELLTVAPPVRLMSGLQMRF